MVEEFRQDKVAIQNERDEYEKKEFELVNFLCIYETEEDPYL